jgi:CheY-like chemotaxis protein
MRETQKGKPIEILLVEDNPDDVILTREAFAESKIMNNLRVVENGEDALKYLYRQEPYAATVRPHLILLDLNLPKISGREVLEKIKQDENLMDIPVVILTTSKAEEDILKSYRLHANCYITKPVDFSKFMDIVRTIESFWFSVVTLPDNEGML